VIGSGVDSQEIKGNLHFTWHRSPSGRHGGSQSYGFVRVLNNETEMIPAFFLSAHALSMV
jgi:hypothetical protein